MPEPNEFELNEVLAHAGFVRRLAGSLVVDENDRDDLVQEAWMAALRVPPRRRDASGLRAWLTSVVRHAALRMFRDRTHRRTREERAAREEGVSDRDVEAELGVQARVLTAVRSLREPYRTTIHLRYLRGLSPRAIADETGVPLATVDTRLTRGRALLREELTRAYGDRQSWGLALLPMCPMDSSPSGLWPAAQVLGAWSLSVQLKIAAAAAAVSVLAFVTWWAVPTEAAAGPVDVERTESRVVDSVTQPESVAPSAVREVRAEAPSKPLPATEVASTDQAPTLLARGRVLDPGGRGWPSVALRFHPQVGSDDEFLVESDSTGAFELGGLPAEGTFVVADPELVTVLSGDFRSGASNEIVVVAAERIELTAEVLDEAQLGLADASVELVLPPGFRTRFETNLDRSNDVRFRALTRTDGRATLSAAPAIDGASLLVQRDGYAQVERELGVLTGTAERLERFVLTHLDVAPETLTGWVLDAEGQAIESAAVSYGLLSTQSAADGRFFFDLASDDGQTNSMADENAKFDLMAVRPGFLPAVLRPQRDANGAPLWPDPIELRPIGAPLSITGRVVDAAGEPLADYLVFLPEAHLVSGSMRTLEGFLASVDGEFLHGVHSDSDGSFELGGLLAQDYAIAAIDERTLRRGELAGVAAGTSGVRIRVDTHSAWRVVRGVVVDPQGDPVVGAVVRAYARTQTARGAMGTWSTTARVEPIETDEYGEFEFRDLPREGVQLAVQHPDIMWLSGLELESFEAPEADSDRLDDLEIVAQWRYRLQVALTDPRSGDEIRVLDSTGGELELWHQSGQGYGVREDNPLLIEGRSKQLFVTGEAATLVLLREGAEVKRQPLDLRPRRENRIEL